MVNKKYKPVPHISEVNTFDKYAYVCVKRFRPTLGPPMCTVSRVSLHRRFFGHSYHHRVMRATTTSCYPSNIMFSCKERLNPAYPKPPLIPCCPISRQNLKTRDTASQSESAKQSPPFIAISHHLTSDNSRWGEVSVSLTQLYFCWTITDKCLLCFRLLTAKMSWQSFYFFTCLSYVFAVACWLY